MPPAAAAGAVPGGAGGHGWWAQGSPRRRQGPYKHHKQQPLLPHWEAPLPLRHHPEEHNPDSTSPAGQGQAILQHSLTGLAPPGSSSVRAHFQIFIVMHRCVNTLAQEAREVTTLT